MLATYVHVLLLVILFASTPESAADNRTSEYKAYSLHESFSFSHPDHPDLVLNGIMKIVFPADPTSTVVRSDSSRSPFPLVVFLGGAFIESNRYQWLGERLAIEHGVAWVVVDLLVPIGQRDVLRMAGGIFESHEPNPGIVAIFEKLREVNRTNQFLKDSLDVDKVILGGHSWGGRVVLVDGANKGFFPNVVGAFIYAAHAERLPGPGYIPGKMLPLEGSVPLLLMASRTDTLLGRGLPTSFNSSIEAVRYMYENAIGQDRKSYYVEFDGFSHVAIVHPEDNTLPVDIMEVHPFNKIRMLDEFYQLVSLFVLGYALDEPYASNTLADYLYSGKSSYIVDVRTKG